MLFHRFHVTLTQGRACATTLTVLSRGLKLMTFRDWRLSCLTSRGLREPCPRAD